MNFLSFSGIADTRIKAMSLIGMTVDVLDRFGQDSQARGPLS